MTPVGMQEVSITEPVEINGLTKINVVALCKRLRVIVEGQRAIFEELIQVEGVRRYLVVEGSPGELMVACKIPRKRSATVGTLMSLNVRTQLYVRAHRIRFILFAAACVIFSFLALQALWGWITYTFGSLP